MSKCVDFEDLKTCLRIAIKNGWTLKEFYGSVLEWKDFVDGHAWRMASDETPEEKVPVNITWINKDPDPIFDDLGIGRKPETATGIYFRGNWYWHSVMCVTNLEILGRSDADRIYSGVEVIAWAPLPEPCEIKTDKA